MTPRWSEAAGRTRNRRVPKRGVRHPLHGRLSRRPQLLEAPTTPGGVVVVVVTLGLWSALVRSPLPRGPVRPHLLVLVRNGERRGPLRALLQRLHGPLRGPPNGGKAAASRFSA